VRRIYPHIDVDVEIFISMCIYVKARSRSMFFLPRDRSRVNPRSIYILMSMCIFIYPCMYIDIVIKPFMNKHINTYIRRRLAPSLTG